MEKIPIWGENIPFNNKRVKADDMHIKGNPNKIIQTLRFLKALPGDLTPKARTVIDTFTYTSCLRPGRAKPTYEDVPYLVPFLVPGSDKAVIVVPGGGFAYKSSDSDGEGNQGEGDLMAKELNKAGINAFVLWYRTNPYKMPVPFMDMQRAVRYLRFHAKTFGLNPDKIGAVGFSAGGYQIAGLMNLHQGKDTFPTDYVKDDIDACSDQLNNAGLIYPCLTFQHNQAMLAACFDETVMDSKENQKKIMQAYDCIENCSSAAIPQFLCHGDKDTLVNPIQHGQYMDALKKAGGRCEYLVVHGASHGYGASIKSRAKYGYWIDAYLKWCNEQFD